MVYHSLQRYFIPKWQARVVPSSAAFKFNNGVIVANLWELKQALRVVREDIIAEHVNDKKNDLADWVQNVVKDQELADELRRTTTRWGLIVGLERQMMRTINLPWYVADRWLQKTDLPFYFFNGKSTASLDELEKILGEIEDSVVDFHLERDPNDIAKWVNDVIGDYLLAEILCESTSREQMITFVADHIVMLRDALECK